MEPTKAALERGRVLLRYVRAAAALQDINDLKDIGRRARVSPQAMREWATKGARPSPDTLDRIADAVALSRDELHAYVYRGGPPPRLMASIPRRISVVPLPERRKRRQRWLELARDRVGWTRAETTRQVGNAEYGQWENGVSDPQGAEVERLARVLDIPTWLVDDPPATDEERLSRWHYDSPVELREAV